MDNNTETNSTRLTMQRKHREQIDHYYKCFRLNGEFRKRLAAIPAADTYLGAARAAAEVVINPETPYCIAEAALKFISIIHTGASAAAGRGKKIERPARAEEEQQIRIIHAGALRAFWAITYKRAARAHASGNDDSARSFAGYAAELWKSAERVTRNTN